MPPSFAESLQLRPLLGAVTEGAYDSEKATPEGVCGSETAVNAVPETAVGACGSDSDTKPAVEPSEAWPSGTARTARTARTALPKGKDDMAKQIIEPIWLRAHPSIRRPRRGRFIGRDGPSFRIGRPSFRKGKPRFRIVNPNIRIGNHNIRIGARVVGLTGQVITVRASTPSQPVGLAHSFRPSQSLLSSWAAVPVAQQTQPCSQVRPHTFPPLLAALATATGTGSTAAGVGSTATGTATHCGCRVASVADRRRPGASGRSRCGHGCLRQ